MTRPAKRLDTTATSERLSDAALDAVVGGRMKLPGPVVASAPTGGGTGTTIGEWSGFPHYLGPF